MMLLYHVADNEKPCDKQNFNFQDGRRFFKMVPKTDLTVYTILADDQLELTFCGYLLTRTDKCLGTLNIPQS